MKRISFYITEPFVFNIKEDFDLLFSQKLSSDEKTIFKIEPVIRQNVKKAFISMINEFGFDYDNDIGIVQIKYELNTHLLAFPNRFYKMLRFLHLWTFKTPILRSA